MVVNSGTRLGNLSTCRLDLIGIHSLIVRCRTARLWHEEANGINIIALETGTFVQTEQSIYICLVLCTGSHSYVRAAPFAIYSSDPLSSSFWYNSSFTTSRLKIYLEI